jgi:hypothetical protein
MAFTTVQYIRMVSVAVVTGATTQYTVPASRQDVIKCITVNNSTGAAITFSMNAPAASNQLFSSVSIPPNQTLTWTGTLVLNAADTITTTASAVGLFLSVSGLESQ